MNFVVRVEFDEAERRFFVVHSDIPGLNVEADSFEELVDIVREVSLDLLGAGAAGSEITFERRVALV